MTDKEKSLRDHVRTNYIPDVLGGKRGPKPGGTETADAAVVVYERADRALDILEKKTEPLTESNREKQEWAKRRNLELIEKSNEIRKRSHHFTSPPSKRFIALRILKEFPDLAKSQDGVLLSVYQITSII